MGGGEFFLDHIRFDQIEVNHDGMTQQLQQQQQQQQPYFQSGHVPVVVQTNPTTTSDTALQQQQVPLSHGATCESPSTQDWPGQLGFSVRVPPPIKSKDAQYSARLNKLYVNQNRAVQVMFNVRPADADPSTAANLKVEGLKIRAVAIYTRPDDFPQPVTVCYAHSRNR